MIVVDRQDNSFVVHRCFFYARPSTTRSVATEKVRLTAAGNSMPLPKNSRRDGPRTLLRQYTSYDADVGAAAATHIS